MTVTPGSSMTEMNSEHGQFSDGHGFGMPVTVTVTVTSLPRLGISLVAD
jgi:hypothetical protein